MLIQGHQNFEHTWPRVQQIKFGPQSLKIFVIPDREVFGFSWNAVAMEGSCRNFYIFQSAPDFKLLIRVQVWKHIHANNDSSSSRHLLTTEVRLMNEHGVVYAWCATRQRIISVCSLPPHSGHRKWYNIGKRSFPTTRSPSKKHHLTCVQSVRFSLKHTAM